MTRHRMRKAVTRLGGSRGRHVYYVPADGFIDDERGWRVSIVFEDESGHFPTGHWPYEGKVGQRCPYFVKAATWEDAQDAVEAMNEALGYTAKEASLIVARSMSIKDPPR